jgi:hypothetical protein
MSETTSKNSVTDFELAVAARNGDQAVMNTLWNRYRKIMIGVIGKYNYRLYHLSQAELESEAAEVFMHKLRNVFKPEKVRKPPDEWSFSYMLTGGSSNLRGKIIKQARNYGFDVDVYDEGGDLPESEFLNQTVINRVMQWDDREYTKYNPEKTVIEERWVSEKMKALNNVLTPFQKIILKLQRAGMTIREIADHMGCGFTKIRLQIVDAKEAAAEIICA